MNKLKHLQDMAAIHPDGCSVRAGTVDGVVVFTGLGAQIRTADAKIVARFLIEDLRKQRAAGRLTDDELTRAETAAGHVERGAQASFVVSWSVPVGRGRKAGYSPRYTDHATESSARAYAEGVAKQGHYPTVWRAEGDDKRVEIGTCVLVDAHRVEWDKP